ncbi:hypothetical protein CI109_103866 [Kwoniella shandongensis]|uniref:Uncharacterized protein n=1 Tax=Kwoniella shandongensis TaxID=1734106 RepID=A0AAJ8MY55_9TREE
MSARRPPTLLPTAIYSVLPRFLRGDWVRPTDSRLASLIRVVQAAHVMGGKAETVESLEAFNEDVNGVEQSFLSWSAGMEPGHDRMGQHFPFRLGVIEGALEPDEGLVKLLSFAIDQYFVVM